MKKGNPYSPRIKTVERFSFLTVAFAIALFSFAFYLNMSHRATAHRAIRADMPAELSEPAATAYFNSKAANVDKQYRLTNSILGLLFLMTLLFTLAIIRLIREEHQLSQLRSRFVATVSHELRTPLSLIQLYAESLFHDRVATKNKRDYLQTIMAETQRLTGLVNNVMDFSRLSSGIRNFQTSNSNISELSWSVIEEFKYRLTLEGFRIQADLQRDIHANLDPQAFCRILFNLLDNAIKYSEKEKFISIELSQTDDSVLLRIGDHGIGIPEEAKPFIYADYFRADDPRVVSQRGSGIGLSVVKQLLDSMNATIEVTNQKKSGSIFTVTIPRNTSKESKTDDDEKNTGS